MPAPKRYGPRHRFMLNVPLPLWERLVERVNAEDGQTATSFVVEAVREKLDNDDARREA